MDVPDDIVFHGMFLKWIELADEIALDVFTITSHTIPFFGFSTIVDPQGMASTDLIVVGLGIHFFKSIFFFTHCQTP